MSVAFNSFHKELLEAPCGNIHLVLGMVYFPFLETNPRLNNQEIYEECPLLGCYAVRLFRSRRFGGT
jgi:hypothetical protein